MVNKHTRGIKMNIKLQKLITLFNERKNFFNNHPDSYRFMCDTFSKKLPEGTEIQIIVKKPQEEAHSTHLTIETPDKVFVDSISDILSK